MGLALFAALARTLSKEQFALYSLIFGFLAILRLTTLPGLGTAVSQAFARGNFGGFGRAVKLSVAGSSLGSVLLALGALWNFHLGHIESSLVYIIAAIAFPLVSGLMMWRNAVAGVEEYRRLLAYDSLSAVLKCLAVVGSVWAFPGSLLPIIIASLIAPALINIVATADRLRIIPHNSHREPDSLRYGIRTTFYQVPTLLSQQLDKIVLFYLISPEALAVYAVALRIPELARTVVGETNATLGPLFAREKSYNKALQRFSIKLWLVYCAISVAGAVLVVPVVLPVLAGPQYNDSIIYAQIMTAGVALGYLGDIQFRYIKSHLHSKSFLQVTVAKSAFDCVLILGLANYFGLAGIVAAYVLKNLIYTFITMLVIRFHYAVIDVPGNIEDHRGSR